MTNKNNKVMKANEAPEKIWINPLTDLPKLNGVIDRDSIQYVRKDAFIEKACEWLEEIFSEYENLTDYNPTNDFINYMKGE
jgi:hypothetical protein